MSSYANNPSGLAYPEAGSVACTAVVTCFNEEAVIENALSSLIWAAEIIVVDAFSTDQTLAIASRFPVQVVQREYINAADQKNFIIPRATHSMVFILDADEYVPPELAHEIMDVINASDFERAYWIRRKNWFMGARIRYSGWQSDKVVRLFPRHLRYQPKAVHSEVDTREIETITLRGFIHHNTFRSMDRFLAKMQRYARLSAADHRDSTGNLTLYHWMIKPAFRFFRHYILQGGILDGYRGFIISSLMAWGVFLRYLYMSQNRQNR